MSIPAAITFLRQRSLIILTIGLIGIVIGLDRAGYFVRMNAEMRAVLPPGETAAITGTVKRIEKQDAAAADVSFVLSTRSINDRSVRTDVLVRYRGPEPVAEGDIVHVTATVRNPRPQLNPGEFDYAEYLRRRSIAASADAFSVIPAGRDAFAALPARIRSGVISVFDRYLPAELSGVVTAMVTGDKTGIDPDTKTRFTDAGVMHVLVASGMNVAYCSALFLGLFRLFGFPRRTAALLTIPFIVLYVLVAGVQAPVVRAGVMALFVIVSLALAREPRIYHALSAAALVILLGDPQALFTASFQLSFAATIGIVALYPRIMRVFNPLPRPVRNTLGGLLSVSLAAQLAVAPLLAFYFNKVSIIALASNLLVVPLVGVITFAGILLPVFHYLLLPIAPLCAAVCRVSASALLTLVNFFSAFPGAILPVATPSPFDILAYYLILFGAVAAPPFRFRVPALIALTLIWTAALAANRLHHRGDMRVTFLAVGDGDAIVVRFGDGTHWLFDGGGSISTGQNIGERVICPYLRNTGVRCLDRVVITHPHLSHYGGLTAVIESFPVNEVLVNAEISREPEYAALMETIVRRNARTREVWAGDSFTVDGATVSVLAPSVLRSGPDDNCLVLAVDYAGRRVLLTSDMTSATEQELLARGIPLTAAVLQLPAHGIRQPSYQMNNFPFPGTLVVSGAVPGGAGTPNAAAAYATGKMGAVTAVINAHGKYSIAIDK